MTILSLNYLKIIFPPLHYLGNPQTNSFFATLSNQSELKRIIMKFLDKNCSINDVPVFIYKKLSESLSKLLSDFFDKSLSIRKFPICIKMVRIVPVPKGGDNTLLKNYRPICILNITKIFEKLMHMIYNSIFKGLKNTCQLIIYYAITNLV